MLSLRLAAILTALLLTACNVAPQGSAGTAPARVMTISGHGEARAAPDMSTISAGVRTQAATAEAALRANTAAMTAVFEAMRKVGVEDKDMQTSNFSVQPVYEQRPYDQPQLQMPKIIGYQVFNQVSVIIRDLTMLGTALDTFVTAGANELYGVGFGIADEDPFLDKAREAAIKDAIRKAELMTKAAGVKLGKLVSISESSYAPPMPVYAMDKVRSAEAAPVPTAAGEQVLQADATLTYEIE